MQSIHLSNGDPFPVLGLGTWKSEPGVVGETIKQAVRMGYRHIDCAAIYANEAEIGNALTELIQDGEVQRQDLFITSKLWNDCQQPDQVGAACARSMADLQVDYLDLYLVHWPVAFQYGLIYPEDHSGTISRADLPLEATWGAMESLVKTGQCRHIGTANFSRKKLQQLVDGGRLKPEVNQIEMHPYLQQPAMVDFCRQAGIVITAYAPLGSGGRPEPMKQADEPFLLEDPVLTRLATETGATPAKILLQWGIARGTVVIPKTVNPSRLQENLAATELTLPPEALAAIDGLDRHRRYFDGTFWDFPETGYTLASLWDGD